MRAKLIIASLFFCLSAATLNAQFYTQGSDPGRLLWSQMETDAYKIIYPRGLDSLARVYATNLEAYRERVGQSVGQVPGTSYKTKTPVILHSHHSLANGLAFLAPRRMELFTVPDALGPIPMPNAAQLTIHEQRHVAQLENFHNYPFRWVNVLFGSAGAGALSSIYGGMNFIEGDAVVAETALSASGRGRTADFLEYMRVSFDEGQYRNYWQWRWGSLNRYTPDHYRIGYVSVAGIRTYLGAPDYSAQFFARLKQHHGVAFYNTQKTIKETTGRTFKEGMDEILHRLGDDWKADADSRGPFYQSKQITSDHRRFTEYKHLETLDGNIYAVRSGIDKTPSLVCIYPDGREERLRSFSSASSRLQADKANGRIYWSEYRADARWDLESFSDIYYLDKDRSVHRLTRRHRYFHPAPAGGLVAVVEFPVAGGSRAVLLDAESGREVRQVIAPDDLQLSELAWNGDELYASAISDKGFGLYRLSDFSCVLEPQPVKITQLFARGGRLLFTSDLNGVNELYSVNPATGEAVRWTNNRNGASDFRFADGGKTIISSVLSTGGRNVYKTDISSLSPAAVDFGRLHKYPMAEELSAQETTPAPKTAAKVSNPRNYSKLGHLIKFHSWIPAYVNSDAVMKGSFESVSTMAGLGATAFFQNDLGTSWGSVAYHAGHNSDGWRHSGHLKYTFAGWLPVFEASFDFNDRFKTESAFFKDEKGEKVIKRYNTATPATVYALTAYIPLHFNSNGVLRGLIPQVRASGSNDTFLEKTTIKLNASLRAYAMLPVAPSNIYPRWGIGTEIGYNIRPAIMDYYCQTAYGKVYAYLPGFGRTHGIRVSGLYAQVIGEAMYVDSISSLYPRGFDSSALTLISGHRQQALLSADYALPFGSVDWAGLCPWFYLKNFELDFHFDYALFASPKHSGNLYSGGADFKLHLSNFLWAPFDTHIGVSYNYNAGNAFDELVEKVPGTERHRVAFIFGIDL